MRRVLGILAVFFLSLAGAMSPAHAGVDVRVDIPAQRMTVTTTDGEVHHWAISSGRKGFRSPNGIYRPTRLERSWYSRKYGGAMPYAVFFRGGYAIHGTSAVGALGRPASHGCIRLHPANAAKFFALVKKHGAGSTRIALNGAAPDGLSQFASARGGKSKVAKAKPRIKAMVARSHGKATIARNKQRAIAAGHGANWNAARGQLLLRPALPEGAIGYQPYDLQRYYQTGPRWR